MNTQIRNLDEADAAAYQSIRRRPGWEIGARESAGIYDILWMSRTLQAREE